MVHTFWATRADHTGCSKRLSSKAVTSEEAKRTLRYVDPLSDARTPHGKRCVSTHRGRAGEKGDFFSMLLAKPVTADSSPQAIVVERHPPGSPQRLTMRWAILVCLHHSGWAVGMREADFGVSPNLLTGLGSASGQLHQADLRPLLHQSQDAVYRWVQ